ncbi:hypothetical protein [Oceaniglobus indicus]|uniref:hypothetical protein n=1 Tax=Oceaniglobus indicus TaxID=2047749 RepID=UPI000C18A502|nr:hypothetical protein [Oceaniglobus indicus]
MKNLVLAGLILLLPVAVAAQSSCKMVRIAPDPYGTPDCQGYVSATRENDAGMWCIRYDRHFVQYPDHLGGRMVLEDMRWTMFIVTHRKSCG